VAKQEVRRAYRRCASRDVRARDDPHEMAKHALCQRRHRLRASEIRSNVSHAPRPFVFISLPSYRTHAPTHESISTLAKRKREAYANGTLRGPLPTFRPPLHKHTPDSCTNAHGPVPGQAPGLPQSAKEDEQKWGLIVREEKGTDRQLIATKYRIGSQMYRRRLAIED
jgi:hypothetical protein